MVGGRCVLGRERGSRGTSRYACLDPIDALWRRVDPAGILGVAVVALVVPGWRGDCGAGGDRAPGDLSEAPSSQVRGVAYAGDENGHRANRERPDRLTCANGVPAGRPVAHESLSVRLRVVPPLG